MEHNKIKIAFIKFAGMTIGGSELWLHKIAVNLPKNLFEIDFYYCDDAPYIGADHTLSPTSNERIDYLKNNGVSVIKFNVGAKNIKSLTHDWVNTDFWEKFDESKYDIIQTVKAGPKEYPYYKLHKPVVEIVGLANRPDTSKNIAWSFHSSNWQRAKWIRLGGSIERSSVLTAPVEKPQSEENYRDELGIPKDAIVAGFHQRNDNLIASDIPLIAFSEIEKEYGEQAKNWHFIIKNGGSFYRDQAKELDIKNIHFLGATPDSASVSKFLNTLDIFAHGRKDGETFGAILVEAMLHGKPCLSHHSPNGANAQPETMGPAGVFAYNLIEYKNFLLKFFVDANFRNKLTEKAKPHAEKYYSMERCMEEITDVYQKISNHKLINTNNIPKPVSYGYSDLGFLYAGNLEDKKNIAHHILIGGIPLPFYTAIIQSLLPNTKTFLDIVNDTSLYCWLAADYYTKNNVIDSSVCIYETKNSYTETLETIISLNKWENLINIQKENINENIINKDIITIDQSQSNNLLDKIINNIYKNKSILFITLDKSRSILNLQTLLENDYKIFLCGKNNIKEITLLPKNSEKITILCLNKEKHISQILNINKTVLNYKKDNFIFGVLEKQKIKTIINKIIPPYITKEKLISYSKRMLKIN